MVRGVRASPMRTVWTPVVCGRPSLPARGARAAGHARPHRFGHHEAPRRQNRPHPGVVQPLHPIGCDAGCPTLDARHRLQAAEIRPACQTGRVVAETLGAQQRHAEAAAATPQGDRQGPAAPSDHRHRVDEVPGVVAGGPPRQKILQRPRRGSPSRRSPRRTATGRRTPPRWRCTGGSCRGARPGPWRPSPRRPAALAPVPRHRSARRAGPPRRTAAPQPRRRRPAARRAACPNAPTMSSVSAVESARGGIRTWAPAWTADGATGGSPITVGETWRPPWPSWMQGCAPVEAMAPASASSSGAPCEKPKPVVIADSTMRFRSRSEPILSGLNRSGKAGPDTTRECRTRRSASGPRSATLPSSPKYEEAGHIIIDIDTLSIVP